MWARPHVGWGLSHMSSFARTADNEVVPHARLTAFGSAGMVNLSVSVGSLNTCEAAARAAASRAKSTEQERRRGGSPTAFAPIVP